ncbi:AraC family transcriptional regulator [Pseudooceanicola lipolyticus]|uniref:AraC family transcriptional regulator n=2 Tax=Pseudooceanicola lipolyticus TaxID=2029104 RepID=A0A2M8J5J7_9RHOB|nr:AraC family transcriptional regulator [Pseudooceanicola lipolyticus]
MIVQNRPKMRRPLDLAVLLFPAFSNHCLANSIEPLRAANAIARRCCFRWRFVGLTEGEVVSSSGLSVRIDSTLGRAEGGDYLLVMPSYDVVDLDTPECRRALRSARKRFAHLVGLDTGSWLLAGAGLLDGRRATIHREVQIAMAERFPDVQVLPDRVIDDGDILSCGGAQTSFELVLDLIERNCGPLLRLEVAALFLDRSTDAPHSSRPPVPGGTAEAAISIMLRHIETPLPIAEIATQLGMTRKRLEQKCQTRYGIGPRDLYRTIRLREARWLVETSSLSVREIALRCGYADPSALTRAFRQAFDLSPRALRAHLDRAD